MFSLDLSMSIRIAFRISDMIWYKYIIISTLSTTWGSPFLCCQNPLACSISFAKNPPTNEFKFWKKTNIQKLLFNYHTFNLYLHCFGIFIRNRHSLFFSTMTTYQHHLLLFDLIFNYSSFFNVLTDLIKQNYRNLPA